MGMAYFDKINPSIYGRRLGLQSLSSGVTGGSGGRIDALVGAEGLRQLVSTAETTAANVKSYGMSSLPGTSAASSAVYTIDPPIPGMPAKWIDGGIANGPVFLKTANSETIRTSAGSSFTTVKISSVGGCFGLVPLTSASWMAIGITTGTSSQASSFGLTTST